jgi:hypothetical protein
MDTVEVILNEEQAEELHQLLSQALGDLSSEIAATDNPAFKRSLRERRHQLLAIGLKLGYISKG